MSFTLECFILFTQYSSSFMRPINNRMTSLTNKVTIEGCTVSELRHDLNDIVELDCYLIACAAAAIKMSHICTTSLRTTQSAVINLLMIQHVHHNKGMI